MDLLKELVWLLLKVIVHPKDYKGFKISGIAVTPSPIYSLYFYWFAINDNRVSIIIFDTWDVKELNTGTG